MISNSKLVSTAVFAMFFSSAWAGDQSEFDQSSPYQQYMKNQNEQYIKAQQQPLVLSRPTSGLGRPYNPIQGYNSGIVPGQGGYGSLQGYNSGFNPGYARDYDQNSSAPTDQRYNNQTQNLQQNPYSSPYQYQQNQVQQVSPARQPRNMSSQNPIQPE